MFHMWKKLLAVGFENKMDIETHDLSITTVSIITLAQKDQQLVFFQDFYPVKQV